MDLADFKNISNCSQNAVGYLLKNLFEKSSTEQDILYIAENNNAAHQIYKELCSYLNKEDVIFFPGFDVSFYEKISPQKSIIASRIKAVNFLSSPSRGKNLVVTSLKAITQRLAPREYLNRQISLKTGQNYEFNSLIEQLISFGYVRNSNAFEIGEFSVKGSIIDIYTDILPIRIDFFANEIDKIKKFDPATQLSEYVIQEIAFHPISEVVLTDDLISNFRNNYPKHFTLKLNDYLYESIVNKSLVPGIENLLPLFYNQYSNLFDYVNDCYVIKDYDLNDKHLAFIDKIQNIFEIKKDNNVNLLPPYELFLTNEQFNNILSSRNNINIFPYKLGKNSFEVNYIAIPDFDVLAKQKGIMPISLFKEHIEKLRKKVVIACYSEGSRERISHILESYSTENEMQDCFNKAIISKAGKVQLIILPLVKGFETEQFLIVTEQDLMGQKFIKKKAKKNNIVKFLQDASNLVPGEYVVHKKHGIGKFEGLKTIKVQNELHDCIEITYDNNDKLYIPVENIDLVSRYGNEGEVKLDRLGNNGWQERQAKVKNKIRQIAYDLVQIQAARNLKMAPIFGIDNSVYEEFSATFPHIETDEQLSSIEDVRNDLSSGRAMDRLICGDVGFGKTEVALRAAFTIAMQNTELEKYQVAVITPTTLLCRQHYENFFQRLKHFGLKVEQLSRLVPAKKATKIRQDLKEGNVDVIIGTHALLSDKVKIKNLGLLIIDEEQHFGVAQKEYLKKLKSNVHVLTLSATPIPRTLQMSIAGIRDLSLITTPPIDRIAVKTIISKFDKTLIKDAILHERGRGGKIFVVSPRIEFLDDIEKDLLEIVPDLKLVKAHGQMNMKILDQIVSDFYDGKYELMLSTTIIESGLDVPEANTMIVFRPDMLGLSQLYQIRGRVGRSNKKAYAYLILPHKQIITASTKQRLEILQNLDSLGAGFTLASHDMDVRGFGNLLGDEQSGHVKEVGVELYQDMLQEAISELKLTTKEDVEERKRSELSPQLNLDISVLIPDNYVSDLNTRISLYRKMSGLENENDLEAFSAELIDRFGKLPEETVYLIEIMKIKILCKKIGVEKIDSGPKGFTLTLSPELFINTDKLLELATKNPAFYKIKPDNKFIIMKQWEDKKSRIDNLTKELSVFI